MKIDCRGTAEERFWKKVKKTDGCWLWMGSKNGKGYGELAVKGKLLRAHRLSYEFNKGKIPEGLCVCHSCDVTNCVNPAHLWLGTIAENTQDRDRKGRGADTRGEKHPSVKLTDKKVRKIRSLYSTGNFTQRKLAGLFGVVQGTVANILTGITWKHI